jgi:Mn2+/Fe2+ NRAMP family transporter
LDGKVDDDNDNEGTESGTVTPSSFWILGNGITESGETKNAVALFLSWVLPMVVLVLTVSSFFVLLGLLAVAVTEVFNTGNMRRVDLLTYTVLLMLGPLVVLFLLLFFAIVIVDTLFDAKKN